MEVALARLDRFNLCRTPNFEPRRGPSVPTFRVGARTPLLFMPVKCGPEAQVLEWMAALDGVEPDDLPGGFNRRTLVQWLQAHPGRRSFVVLRHPVLRAYRAFADHILSGRFVGIRDGLRRNHGMVLPDPDRRDDYGSAERRADFLCFLKFVRGNLSGQSAIRVDTGWASQGAILRGFAEFQIPDLVLREAELADDLPRLARQFGAESPSLPQADPAAGLREIYDEEIEAAARAAYRNDYTEFGFGDWSATAAS
jgi:hypothetical protein